MRLTKIVFDGYRRLRNTSCNVDNKLIALLGPNEAGKSSVLEALAWFSNGKEPLPADARSRGMSMNEHHEVVTAIFTLEASDLQRIEEIRASGRPKQLHVVKRLDGSRVFRLEPRPQRVREPFQKAQTIAKDMLAATTAEHWKENPASSAIQEALENLLSIIEDPDSLTKSEHDEILATLEEFHLNESGMFSSGDTDNTSELDVAYVNIRSGLERLSIQLRDMRTIIADKSPDDLMRDIVSELSPEFVTFGETDRALSASYNLSDDKIRAKTPVALKNLLHIGGTSLNELTSARDDGQLAVLKTKLKATNRELGKIFLSAWQQSDLSVKIEVDGVELQVLIEEWGEDGAVVPFSERSDGLRMFISLLSFIHAKQPEYPLILLIDEAELHLHLDAQADLIKHLEGLDSVSQVIYTTHSPGCLPQDLGTGVRLVAPDTEYRDTSHLRNNFWESNAPGYNPMLYAMGAGAAAFSACRAAVICEGPTEMILLPSMIKKATGNSQLSFQVAPGLSSFGGSISKFEEVAARVAYLVDGDSGGERLKNRLLKDGVSSDKVLMLPNGLTLEDLLDPEKYIEHVVELVRETGTALTTPELDEIPNDGPMSRRIESWLKSRSQNTPSKVAVASRIVRVGDISLTAEGREVLVDAHRRLCALLTSTAHPRNGQP